MDVKSGNGQQGVIVVKDPEGALKALAVVVFFGALSLWCLVELAIPGLIVCAPLTYLAYVVFKTKNDGVTLDVPNNLLSYPGGKAADDISDYLKLDFWKQSIGMTMKQIKLSDISAMSARSTKVYNHEAKCFHYSNTITFNGSFGSITIPFTNKEKRDQLYTVLRETLQMGEPVVIADK